MIKPFVSLASLLILMVFALGVHYVFFPYVKTSDSMQTLSTLTYMTSLSYSVAYDETSFNATYPDMSTSGRMDFVYDK